MALQNNSTGLSTIGGYTIDRKISSGGMGVVYLGHRAGEHGFKKKVAIKLLLPSLFANPEIKTLFIDEARLAARLDHPNICQIFDFGEQLGSHFLVMEYLEGLRVLDILRAQAQSQTWLDQRLVARIIASAARGLHYAHERRGEDGKSLDVVHRDISPDNILVTRNGTTKVVDFGIARWTDRITETRHSVLRGKAAYMAPEQINRRDVDRRSDVFSLCVVCYELLTRRPLFRRSTALASMEAVTEGRIPPPTQLRPDLVPALDELLLCGLQRDPDLRFPTAQELARSIEVAVRDLGGPARDEELALLVKQLSSQPQHMADWTEPKTVKPGDQTSPWDGTARSPADRDPTKNLKSGIRGQANESKASSDLMQRDPLLFDLSSFDDDDTDAVDSMTSPGSSVWKSLTDGIDELATTTQLAVPHSTRTKGLALKMTVAAVALAVLGWLLASALGPRHEHVSKLADGPAVVPPLSGAVDDPVDPEASPPGRQVAEKKTTQAGAAAGARAPFDAPIPRLRKTNSGRVRPAHRRAEAAEPKSSATQTETATRTTGLDPGPTKPTSNESASEGQALAATGWITVTTSRSYANVRIDGKTIDSTPLLLFVLPIGQHQVELIAPDNGRLILQRDVVVTERHVTKVHFQIQ